MKWVRSSWGLLSSIPPNRIAVYLTVAAGLLTAVAPVIADLDTTSTATVIAGLAAIVVAAVKWLNGWQNLEKAEAQDVLHRNAMERENVARAAQYQQATAPPSRVKLPH